MKRKIKQEKKSANKVDFKKNALILLGIIVVVFVAAFAYNLFSKKTCTDENCFAESSKNCQKSSYLQKTDVGGQVLFEVLGTKDQNCLTKMTVKEIPDNNLFNSWKDKSMDCSFPVDQMKTDQAMINPNYCSGELLEEMKKSIQQ